MHCCMYDQEAKIKIPKDPNMCAKLILNKKKYDSATECLRELHWLPIEQRIKHKILLITHKALNGQAPEYIQELIKIKTPCRQLRSEQSGRLLCTPAYREKHSLQGPSVMLLPHYGIPCHNTLGMKLHSSIQETPQNISLQ